MEEENNLGYPVFPRIKSAEKRWEEVRSNLKLSGFSFGENKNGGCRVTRLRDGKFVVMLWAELYQYAVDIDEFKLFFEKMCKNGK